MKVSPDPRLDELFVRYWDNALSQAETDELETLLANDPVAREWFQILVAQTLVVAELPAGSVLTPETQPTASVLRRPRLSRRKVLTFLGGTFAASIGAGLLGHAWWRSSGESAQTNRLQIRISESKGETRIHTADGQILPAEGIVPPGATVATQGIGSSAILAFEDGSTVVLLSDSSLTIREKGQLQLHTGTASVELFPRADADRITLATALFTLSHVHATSVTLGLGAKSAEVAVYQGEVSVSAPTGEPMTVVRKGEMLTVRENGACSQQPTPMTPDRFSWDLTASLPAGWHIGRREVAGGTPVVRCEPYPDPYYNGTVMHQIRSDSRWARGLFSIVKGSTAYIRYRAKAASPKGQVCFCIRSKQAHCSDTGVLDYNGGFEACPKGEWREIRFTVESMFDWPNKHKPKFDSPWICFLVIFNTYESDVALEVAEFRIDSPGK